MPRDGKETGNATQRSTTMANYLLVYKGGGGMPATDEERNAELARWGAWYGGLGDAVVDGGNPISVSAAVAADGTVTPNAPSGLSGYTILKADSLDAATALTKGCPILHNGGSIEVYETFNAM
jgi:hypothetical protein